MSFGERLAYSRKQQKLSQSELGKIAGIKGDIVGKYERDEMKPSVETAAKLAKALNVSLDYLIGNSDLEFVDPQMLQRLKDIDNLPEDEKQYFLKTIDALLRDYKARQAYTK